MTEQPTVTEQPTATTTPKPKPKPKVKAASKTVSVASKTTVAAKPAPVTTVASNDLPFTGLNTGLVLLLGAVAIAAGLGLRRVAARRHE